MSYVQPQPPPPPLFAKQHARRSDPPASHAAAERVAPRATKQCQAVLAILRRGPIGNGQLYAEAAAAGVLNVRARVSDLRRRGAVVEVEGDVYRLLKDLPGESP